MEIGTTGCNRRNGPDFGRVFLMFNYTENPQNTCIQSWTVWEIMAIENCGLPSGPRTIAVSWDSYLLVGLRVTSPLNIPVWCIVLRTVSKIWHECEELCSYNLWLYVSHKLLWWKVQILTLQKPHIPASFNMNLVIGKCVTAVKVSNFTGHYLPNRPTLYIGVLGFFGVVYHKEHPPEVWSFPPVTPCIGAKR